MVENLDLGRTRLTVDLTPTNTNLASNITIPAATFNSWIVSTEPSASFTDPEIISITAQNSETGSEYDEYGSHYGTLYNYAAVSANTINAPEDQNQSNAASDLCPAGWRLPTGINNGVSQSESDLNGLYTVYNITSSTTATEVTRLRQQFRLPFAGLFYNHEHPVVNQGSSGNYWTSTISAGSFMQALTIQETRILRYTGLYRNYGRSARCVAASKKTMQTVADWGDAVRAGETVTAIDERDGTTYTVARLADGKLWMTKNLRLNLENATITDKNTNNPTTSFLAETTSATSSGSTLASCNSYEPECINQIQYTTINIGDTTTDSYDHAHDEYGVYYNWYTATAGNGTTSLARSGEVINAAGDICPSGWYLPRAKATDLEHNDFWKLTRTIIGADPTNGVSWIDSPEGTNASASLRAQPNNFIYSGAMLSSNIMLQGTAGTWWSSTIEGKDPYSFWVQDNKVQARNIVMSPQAGAPVRCIAQ